MKMELKFYVTTPIYYVNAEPHLGHAYTTIVADVMKRFYRLLGYKTYFVTGTDEHGDKVLRAAREHGMEPKAFVDKMSNHFRELWPRLRCEPDHFIRTTDPGHVRVVQMILQKVYDAGDIYFGQYEGLYCTGCERFYTERELEEGLCPQHRTRPEFRKEANYFFRMSRYQEWLRQHIMENPDFIRPERYRNEALSMLKEPLEDLCISRPRSRLEWGIPLPFDPSFVTYVWFDALINYVSALGYPDSELFETMWPHAQHLIAKDILKPHGIYWPTMLKAAGIPLFRHLNVHGYWNVEASKMSKSLGNVIRPLDLVEKYGLDAFRYFLMREMAFGLDANFSEVALVQRLNADLANDLGNLLQRTLKMVLRYCGGAVPEPKGYTAEDQELISKALEVLEVYKKEMSALGAHRALASVWELIGLANRYVDHTEPFRLAREPSHRERLETVLYCCLEVNRIVGLMLWPVMPGTSEDMARQLGIEPPSREGSLLEMGRWGGMVPGTKLGEPRALFPRVDMEKAVLQMKREDPEAKGKDEITIEDFKKLDLRVAKVVEAQRIEGSGRLLKLRLDMGEQQRTVIAGIAENYQPEEVVGKQVIVVANLKPAKIFGQVSEGMLLAAVEGKRVRIITVDGEISTGAKVS